MKYTKEEAKKRHAARPTHTDTLTHCHTDLPTHLAQDIDLLDHAHDLRPHSPDREEAEDVLEAEDSDAEDFNGGEDPQGL